MNYIIYKTTNIVNNKIYVGQHNTSADDGYLGSGKLFRRALKKYGKESFFRETIEFCTSANVNEREIYWVDNLDATNPLIGYNITEGGNGKRGYIESSKTKTKKSKSHIGKNHSPETKHKISIAHQKYWKSLDQKTSQTRKIKLISVRVIGKRKGTPTSIQARLNMKLAQEKVNHKGQRNINSQYVWTFVSPQGNIYKNIYESLNFCNQFNLSQPGILYAVKHSGFYKGWKVSRLPINS